MVHDETSSGDLDVTLILPTYQGHETIGETLRSVAAQSLDPARFELLIVENGPPCGSDTVIEDWRRQHPQLQVRRVKVAKAGLAHARNLGLSLARGEHVTYVDDDDALSPRFLESLLDLVGPGVVPTAFIVDVPDGVAFHDVEITDPDLDNYFSRSILPFAGSVVPAEKAGSSMSVNAAKLLPVPVARAIAYREELRSGEDFVYWTELFAHTEFCLSVAPVAAGACYLRRVRQGSMSRQESSYDFSVSQRLDCISALDSLPQSTRAIRGVIRDKAAAQANHLREYLTAHPQERSVVLRDVAQRRLQRIELPALTRGLARDVAILYAFAPHADTSAAVASRRIREQGKVVDVVSNNLASVRGIDPLVGRVSQGYVDEVVQLNGPQAFNAWPAIARFMEDAQHELARLQTVKGTYRSVYSRSMWPASTFAAALFKTRNPTVKWVAEFSDPQLVTVTGEERNDRMDRSPSIDELRRALQDRGHAPPDGMRTFAWAEWLPYVLADEVIFTNRNQLEYMLGYCPDATLASAVRAKAVVKPHPTLPSEFYDMTSTSYALEPGVRHIGYFGVFYATRGLREVLEALDGAPRAVRQGVRLHVFTDKPEETRKEIAARQLHDCVVVNAFRPFLEFLNLTTKLDVLLVNDASTREHHPCNPYLPSKLADYLGSGSPIWKVVEPGSAMDEVPTTFRSEIGDVDGAARVLHQLALSDVVHEGSNRALTSRR